MQTNINQSSSCCPIFDPAPWDGKVLKWAGKKFIKDKVATLFYMPLNFGGAMKRLDKITRESGAATPDWLCLSQHSSLWSMNLYMAVDKDIAGAENIVFDGQYFSKVYEGAFSQAGKWKKDFELLAKTKGFAIKELYFWYTTCPKCAKKYGKNYVVLIASIE